MTKKKLFGGGSSSGFGSSSFTGNLFDNSSLFGDVKNSIIFGQKTSI
jgi:hypothetical protein